MPRQISAERLQEYANVLHLRDLGFSFRDIATQLNFTDPRTARFMWIGGLRHSGRASEIPVSTPRRVTVVHNNRTTTLVVPELISWNTNSALTFGIEIECVGLSLRAARTALNTAGITCEDFGYTHATHSVWKVVPDGSLTSRSGSCEVVSPVLSGRDGLTEVRTVMSVLRAAGASINQSCGMHIHIGVDVLTQQHQANIIRNYGAWQYAMTAWILKRRINNYFCALRTVQQTEDLATRWENSNDCKELAGEYDRYFAFNVASYQRHGTFEMRSHHGSLNGMNACAWISLHLAFFDACKSSVMMTTLTGNLPVGATYAKTAQRPLIINGAEQYEVRNANMTTRVSRQQLNEMIAMNGVSNDETNGVSSTQLFEACYPTRAQTVTAGKELCTRLASMHNSRNNTALLADDVCAYLQQRAGNIPVRTEQTN